MTKSPLYQIVSAVLSLSLCAVIAIAAIYKNKATAMVDVVLVPLYFILLYFIFAIPIKFFITLFRRGEDKK